MADRNRVGSRKPGFAEVLAAATVLAVLVGLSLAMVRLVQRSALAERADAQLARWGAGARMYAAEHGGMWPSIDIADSRPTWEEVRQRPRSWYNALPAYEGGVPVAGFAEVAQREWSRQAGPNVGVVADGSAMLRPPAAEYSEPERWAKGPMFGFAWNEAVQGSRESGPRAVPRVLVFESLTHRGDRPGGAKADLSSVGHAHGGEGIAADRYRRGTGAVLTDGSLRRLAAEELPW